MSIFRPDALAGQVALITGGGSGIGLGIAHAFMEHGADTVIMSRDQVRLDAAAGALTAATGRRCLAVAADVRDPDQVDAGVARAVAACGRIDVLVNGAAGNFLAPAVKVSPRGFKTVLEIDAGGAYTVSRSVFIQTMKQTGGSIINLSATLHYMGLPFQAPAGAAKAAIDALTRHLAVEWGPANVRVNSLSPGLVSDTEGERRLAAGGVSERIAAATPLRRNATIDDCAQAAIFLASPAAAIITGAILVVDGGSWMTMGGLSLFSG